MIRYRLLPVVLIAAPAWADGTNVGTDREAMRVNMRVPALCVLGTTPSGEGVFDVGTLSDRETGYLRRDLQAPDQRLVASFCNSSSLITIVAEPMIPQGAGDRAPRTGFGRRIHYVARASGWTDDPAVYDTSGAATQAGAIQRRNGPRESDIVIALSNFSMDGGGSVRPIAGRYQGTVIVTLGPTS